jgi:hypothetical protein
MEFHHKTRAFIVWNSSPNVPRDDSPRECFIEKNENYWRDSSFIWPACPLLWLIINYFIDIRSLIRNSQRILCITPRHKVRREVEVEVGKGKKFSPVQKWCRCRVGTGDVAMIALRLCIRWLLLVIVHHVLLVVWSTVLLQTRLRQAVLTIKLIVMLQISEEKRWSLINTKKIDKISKKM